MSQKLDFTGVEVHLYTSDGLLKHSSDCAPNGYFFIPVYDKGTFYLQVEGPDGWAFEPKVYNFQITDEVNSCSEDISFMFTGFSLSGTISDVQIAGCADPDAGPTGVKLTLSAGAEAISSTKTGDKGFFRLSNIFPAAYRLSAQHPKWEFQGDQSKDVQLGVGNMDIMDAFIISGYEVDGSISSFGEKISNVSVYLFGPSDISLNSIGCSNDDKLLVDYKLRSPQLHSMPTSPICSMKTNEAGKFLFTGLPCGQYEAVACYGDKYTSFDIAPRVLKVSVGHGDLSLGEAFKVMGFSVSGQVLSPTGKGIEGASIIVNGLQKATTDAEGTYVLERMTSGKYVVTASKDHMIFASLRNQMLSPSSGRLPPILISKFDVCGSADSGDSDSLSGRIVELSGPDDLRLTTKTNAKGQFCFSVPPGKYNLIPSRSAKEKTHGLILSPSYREIDVIDEPIFDVIFVKASVKLGGKIKCLSQPCVTDDLLVALLPNFDGDVGTTETAVAKDGTFTFENVHPGMYTVKARHPRWCFENGGQTTVQLSFDTSNSVEIVQSGHLFECRISHNLEVDITTKNPDIPDRSFKLEKGINRFCIAKPGVYSLKPSSKSCFQFGQEWYSYDTKDPKPLTLQAVKYRVQGDILLPDLDIKPSVRITRQDSEVPIEYELEIIGSVASYSFWAEKGDKFQVSVNTLAESKDSGVVFHPTSQSYHVDGEECPEKIPQFSGRLPSFAEGKISPSIPGVEVRVYLKQSEFEGKKLLSTTLSSEDGSYIAGPLYDEKDSEYIFEASCPDFVVVVDKTHDKLTVDFKAMRLGKVRISATVENVGLEGVLLSLSGDKGYRSNNSTDSQGFFEFGSLFPGSYFLRPLLKEYKFEPRSVEINIEENSEFYAKFEATRVAYSLYGSVSSLNLYPEPGITMEAIGIDESGKKPKRYESTQSDVNGDFRLRGLYPGYTYTIRVKKDKTIEKSAPDSYNVTMENEDIRGVELTVFKALDKFDITGNVNAPKELLDGMQVELQTSEGTKVVKVSEHLPFFQFFAMPTGTYKLSCKTSLISKKTHVINNPMVSVDLRNGHVHVNLEYSAEIRKFDDSGPLTSMVSLLIGLVFLGSTVYSNQIQKYVKRMRSFVDTKSTETTSEKPRSEKHRGNSGKRRRKGRGNTGKVNTD
eukprot:CAMPEP_0167766640 /NCGR_PEP_ID=MMETSP0110_2-20121227/15482_1 /TAXON_ID=629695 /ORGANISM="Gymnochlora sp., Strain CCMP2014" /LENGTH=1157 /DNA_ID=CAMNT_0007654741 /DNA_START=57 /DNA_END=3530 /DNA_ORIENTATION=+